MTQKITDDATMRLRANPPREVLRTMRELERKAAKLREALDADQSDINVAFEADGLSWSGQHARLSNPKGWDTSIEP